jgi:hypothetical protein
VIPVTVSWTGGAHDGLWTTPGNWSTGKVPGPSDDVLISDPGTPLILLTNAQSIHSLFSTTPVAVTSGSLAADHLRFAANLTLGPGGTVGAPTLIIGPGSSLIGAGGSLSGAAVTGNVVVNASNTLFMNGGVTLVGGVSSLSVAPAAKVDVTGGTLQLPYGSAAAPDSAVRGLISGGRITASGSSVGFADSADGIVSTLPPTTILVKPALAGDANLDGRVDFSDLLVLAQHYNAGGANWDQGDFTGDGNVSFNDLLTLAQEYGRSLPPGVRPSRHRR